MKPLILTLIVVTSLSLLWACNSDDNDILDPPISTKDPIIGLFNLTKVIIDGVDETSQCTTQSSIRFDAGNNISSKQYENHSGNCDSHIIGGSWENSNGTYVVVYGIIEANSKLDGDTFTLTYKHFVDETHKDSGKIFNLEYKRQK